MDFHLQFPISPFSEKIKYTDKMLFMGSCFAENIAGRMADAKLAVIQNPHGILYNPSAIAVALNRYIENREMHTDELFLADECWRSWEHHTSFAHAGRVDCLNRINTEIKGAHAFLKEARWLFITFGSAFGYTLTENNTKVGNCHKIPGNKFSKSIASVNEVTGQYEVLFKKLSELNPSLNIVLTVSPVRYIRDGVVENNLSKGILLQAVHHLVKAHFKVSYFPAYELVTDDLRDYRFYERDMVHPTEQAIDYVFSKFRDAAFGDAAIETFAEVEELKRAVGHRPHQPGSAAHKKFMETYLQRCRDLQARKPYLDLTDLAAHFNDCLSRDLS